MYHFLTSELYFPPVEQADKNGILAFGGDLSVGRLILAYKNGIFPWFNSDEPIIWWSPPQRMVVYPNEFKMSKSMRNIFNKNIFTVTFNQNFREVILGCQQTKRPGQDGTWLTDDMLEAYCEIHDMGMGKSVEVWQDGKLVGGLYGVDQGHVFSGESMFSTVSNASKVAFVALVEKLKAENYLLLDCQVHNEHLESLGAREIPRNEFLTALKR